VRRQFYQGCQMVYVYFHTKTLSLGFCEEPWNFIYLDFYFAISDSLLQFVTFYDDLAYFLVIWYVFPFWYLCWYEHETSGNPEFYFQDHVTPGQGYKSFFCQLLSSFSFTVCLQTMFVSDG
jgi:hypothetical protein